MTHIRAQKLPSQVSVTAVIAGGALMIAALLTPTYLWGDNEPVLEPVIPQAIAQEFVAATNNTESEMAAMGGEAEQMNDALPFSSAKVEVPRAFTLKSGKFTDSDRAMKCMTQAIYYEAGFEPENGKRAVAQVILNRMQHPAFPKSICGVVYQGSSKPGCQFSFTCDGSLLRAPQPGAWAQAQEIARAALSGGVAANIGTATHYHANYVSPYWAPKLNKITRVGAHIFYRWPGNWGRRIAFSAHYSGNEFIPALSSLANINDTRTTDNDLDIGDAALPRVITDRRADNDVGGRIDPTKTWRLTIPMPGETGSAYKQLAAQQSASAAPAATLPNIGEK